MHHIPTWLESNPGPPGRQLWRDTDFSGSEYDFARAPPEVSKDVTDDDEVPLLHLHKTKDSKYRNRKIRRMLNVCWIFEWKKHLAGWMDISKRNGLQRWMHLICSRVRGRRPRETLHRIECENMVRDLVFCLVQKLLQESSENFSSVFVFFAKVWTLYWHRWFNDFVPFGWKQLWSLRVSHHGLEWQYLAAAGKWKVDSDSDNSDWSFNSVDSSCW